MVLKKNTEKRQLLLYLIIWSAIIIICPLCKSQELKIKPENSLSLNKEGWLRDDVFQIIESLSNTLLLKKNDIQNKALQKAHYRTAQLVTFSRYKIYKDELDIIKKLADFPPFKKTMKGTIIFMETTKEGKRIVYRIKAPRLKRKLKRVLNAFEEFNPKLKYKIRHNDFTF